MVRRLFIAPVMGLCLCVFCLPVSAQDEDRAVSRLQTLLGDTITMSADVTQAIMESDGGILEESLIRMYHKRPEGFYWETLEPFPELVVTNGQWLWNYQPDLEQVVVEPWDSSRSELAAQLLNGETASLGRDYGIELLEGESGSISEFRLTPVATDSIYARITISFVGSELDMIHLQQKNGENTLWRFENVQRNQPLDDNLFEFEPPPGIEVIENDYAQ